MPSYAIPVEERDEMIYSSMELRTWNEEAPKIIKYRTSLVGRCLYLWPAALRFIYTACTYLWWTPMQIAEALERFQPHETDRDDEQISSTLIEAAFRFMCHNFKSEDPGWEMVIAVDKTWLNIVSECFHNSRPVVTLYALGSLQNPQNPSAILNRERELHVPSIERPTATGFGVPGSHASILNTDYQWTSRLGIHPQLPVFSDSPDESSDFIEAQPTETPALNTDIESIEASPEASYPDTGNDQAKHQELDQHITNLFAEYTKIMPDRKLFSLDLLFKAATSEANETLRVIQNQRPGYVTLSLIEYPESPSLRELRKTRFHD